MERLGARLREHLVDLHNPSGFEVAFKLNRRHLVCGPSHVIHHTSRALRTAWLLRVVPPDYTMAAGAG